MRRILAAGIVGAAALACGGGLRGVEGPADGCPPAAAVRYAEWRAADELHPTAAWAVPLGAWADDPTDSNRVPALQPGLVDPSAVINRGHETLPAELWLLREGGAPCLARVTGYLAEPFDDPRPGTQLSALATGCEPAADATDRAWLLLVATPPTACSLVMPTAVGRFAAEEADGGFAIAETREPLPAPWADVTPVAECEPPCATLWDVRATAGEPALTEVLVTRITPSATADACGWPATDHHAIYASRAGAAPVELAIPDLPADGAMTLAGALVDAGGTRVALFTDAGAWAAYPVGDDGLGAGRRTRFLLPSEYSFVHRSLAPFCP